MRAIVAFLTLMLAGGLSAFALPQTAPMETQTDYGWAEVYVGSGEVMQGETLTVTVSDLRSGREIAASVTDASGAVVIPIDAVPAADQYGDTNFTLSVPFEVAAGAYSLVLTTDEFEPINVPLTVTASPNVPAPPVATEQPPTEVETEAPPAATDGSATPAHSSPAPPVPAWVLIAAIGGVALLIIVTAIVRNSRNRA